MAISQLVVWSAVQAQWLSCPPDEIVWLDRARLSAGQDPTLHRSPRCAGLRYVHYRWELFSRDTTHQIFAATYAGDFAVGPQVVQSTAKHVLPMATAAHETLPVRLDGGTWLLAVGNWVLPISIDVPAERREHPTAPHSYDQPPTQEGTSVILGAVAAASTKPPVAGAAEKVRAFFERNGTARMAMAYYYQQFILGTVGPQEVAMVEVAIALDLKSEGSISDYKKELQRRIWGEQRHQRDLAEFLLGHGLLGQADLDRARKVAAVNEQTGRTEAARERLRYRQRNKA
ncbi:MAG: hypothetical protein ABJB47_06075 [Actinomycetota bacterium]